MTLEFAGENPCVILYDEVGTAISAISYWNGNYSLAGHGQALFLVTMDDGRSAGRMFAEAGAPVDYFRSLNQHFLGFEPVEWTAVTPEPARFRAGWEGEAYALACAHNGGTIDVTWRDFEKPTVLNQRSVDFGKEPGRSYDIASVIVGATSGVITLDGRVLPGAVKAPYGALPRSAFLAFCETWTRL